MRLLLVFAFLFSIAFGSEKLEESLQKHIPIPKEGTKEETLTIGHLYIGDHSKEINQGTWIYIKNALDYYKQQKPLFIILELDTPGGEVFAAQKISDALKEIDIQAGIPVVAFINNWAISAGAMLAYSCRYIAVVKDASMGAAEPITQTGAATSEKVKSAIRTDFANRASFFDRNPLLAESMVDSDSTLVLREGVITKLLKEDDIKSSDQVIIRKGKLLTLNSKELIDLKVADIYLPPEKLEPLTAAEKESGKWPAEKELLFQAPYFKEIKGAEIIAYKMDWKTKFFSFLSLSWVSSILFLGLMLSIYGEFQSPGLGLSAIVGSICLFFIILSSFSIQAAPWLEVIILLIGISLLLLELFVLPTFGLLGILGILLTLVGLFLLLLPEFKDVHFDFNQKTFNAAGLYFFERLAWLSSALILGVIIIAIFSRFVAPKWGLYSRFISHGVQKDYKATFDEKKLPKIGEWGVVISPLRPAGKVKINHEIHDAVSSGSFVEEGIKVKVIRVLGNKIIVEEGEE